MARANYSFEKLGEFQIPLITDEYSPSSPTMSITNDMEDVIREVCSNHYGITPPFMICKNTSDLYDIVSVELGRFKGWERADLESLDLAIQEFTKLVIEYSLQSK